MSQKDKTRFRRSSKWKKFKAYVKRMKRIDCITQYPLRNGWNLHHLNLNESDYEDLSEVSHFEPLNRKTHETVHFLYPYYVKDSGIVKRLEEVLERMRVINNEE